MFNQLVLGSDEQDVTRRLSREDEFFAYMNRLDSMGIESSILAGGLRSLMAFTGQHCSDVLSEKQFTGPDWNDDLKDPYPILEDSEVDTTRGIAQADAPLFYNQGWSREFVHGSDAMFPIVKVAEKLLSKGESITNITGGFNQIMKHDIHIVVRDTGNSANSATKTNNSCGSGEIHTSTGRTLKYTIHPLRTRVQDIRTPNQGVYRIISSKEETPEGMEFNVDTAKLLELYQLSNNVAYTASSLYEMATLSAFYMSRLYLKDTDEDYTLTVVREIRNLGTKIDIGNIDTDSTIRGSIRKSKIVGKWTYLFIELDMPFLDKKTEVVAAITHEEVTRK